MTTHNDLDSGFMSSNWEIEEAGLDWITITGKDSDGDCELFEAVCQWQDELSLHHPVRDWGLLGYKGRAAGPVRLGFRNDTSYIIQVSGAWAETALARIPQLDNLHVTRVDFQVTASVGHEQMVAHQAYQKALNLEKDNANYPTVTFITGTRGDTLYLGRRTSDKVLRLYDKGAEQGGSKGFLFRWEVEYKKGRARSAWQQVIATVNRTDFVLSAVKSEFAKLGIEPWFGSVHSVSIVAEKLTPHHEKQLKWLDRCVRPVIVKLSEKGYGSDARRILFGELVQENEGGCGLRAGVRDCTWPQCPQDPGELNDVS